MDRRTFMRRAVTGTIAAAAGTTFYTIKIEPHWVKVVQRALPIQNLPEELDGKRIVQISDLHIGPVVDDLYMKEMLDKVAGMEPDLLAITGDFITYTNGASVRKAVSIIESLGDSLTRCVGIFGNHDYGPGWSDEGIGNSLESSLNGLGVRILRNEILEWQGLQIAGIDDYWGPNFGAKVVLPRINAGRAGLVLCHNPDVVDLPLWGDYKGWILSGHTHGGQCKPPFLPPPILPVQNSRYSRGEFALEGGRRLYINTGLGYLAKVRFNVRPEITEFVLKQKV
ncbi:MAG: metallophosphoesterase [Planctomycetota bacterium]|nr:metallophosphoesterase [Planctomycetota bacterium]MDA1141205.1 metallophosphoesterase [Planctomycetota bacterium]